jgi:hypothetical protein
MKRDCIINELMRDYSDYLSEKTLKELITISENMVFTLREAKELVIAGTKIGTIKRKRCIQTGRFVKMYYTGNFKSEYGSNGHKGWICLHKGK